MSQETEKSLWAEFRALINKNERETAAIVSAVFVGGLALILLLAGQLEGGAFVSMLGLSFVIGLSIALWGGFSELSFLGNSLKLRQITYDVEDRIKKLDASCIRLYRSALLMAMRHPGSLVGGYSDNRVQDYLVVVDAVEEAGVFEPLSEEIFKSVNLLIAKQYERLSTFVHNPTSLSLAHDTPDVIPHKFLAWLSDGGRPYAGDDQVHRARLAVEQLQRLQVIRDKAADTMRAMSASE
ncbi:hypothetical protein ACE3G8_02530 [Vreelandella venusta]